MSNLEQLHPAIALIIAFFVLLGSVLTLVGAMGLLRLNLFYDRLHAPTLGTSWGAAGILIASMVLFSVVGSRWVVHEIFIGIFIMVTTPVTLMVLGRAGLHRDRAEGNPPPGTETSVPSASEPLPTR